MSSASEEKINSLREKVEQAYIEMTRQSGYVEGTLETIISMVVEINPEISMTSDRLIKTFHAIEGITLTGFKEPFMELLKECQDLIEENAFLQKENIVLSKEKKERKTNAKVH